MVKGSHSKCDRSATARGFTPTSSAMKLLISKINSFYLFKRQKFLNDLGCFFLGLVFQMTIGVDGRPNVTMTNPILDSLHWYFVGHHQPRARMPEKIQTFGFL